MTSASVNKTLYVDLSVANLRLDGAALRLTRTAHADTFVPLSRIGRAMISVDDTGTLAACLAIVAQGGAVHLTGRKGEIQAVLQSTWAERDEMQDELTRQISLSSGVGPFRRWKDAQRRHAWSLIFRRNYCGDFEANRKRLVHYLLHFRADAPVTDELDWLENQVAAWLSAQITRAGLTPVRRSLNARGEDLAKALMPCLLLPLIWHYVVWRRHRAHALVSDRVAFFELQARGRLTHQFTRHIEALRHSYGVCRTEKWSRPGGADIADEPDEP